MTTVQLRAKVFEDLNAILDNESAMMKLRTFLTRLRKEATGTSAAEHIKPYTMEELNTRLNEAEAADEADNLVTHEEVMQKARKCLDSL